MKYFILLFLLVITTFVGCKKSQTNESDVTLDRFVAKFINGWIGEGDTVYVIISDENGNTLAMARATSDTTITLVPQVGEGEFPPSISVTTVKIRPYIYRHKYVYITTNMGVSPSTWTWKGYPERENVGEFFIKLENVPQFQKANIITRDRSRTYYSFSNGLLSFSLYHDPDNLLVRLWVDDSNVRFKWIPGISVGDTVIVDMNLTDLERKKAVQFPNWGKGFRYFLSGYEIKGMHYENEYILTSELHKDSVANVVNISYPSNIFKEFRSSLYVYDDYENLGYYNYYRYLYYGSIPSEFKKLDADFDFISTDPQNFAIETRGNFDEIYSFWYAQISDVNFRWYVYSSPSKTRYALPQLPPSIMNKFKGLEINSFKLMATQLIDQINLDSYAQIINTYFKNDNYFYDIVPGMYSRSKASALSSKIASDLSPLQEREGFILRENEIENNE